MFEFFHFIKCGHFTQIFGNAVIYNALNYAVRVIRAYFFCWASAGESVYVFQACLEDWVKSILGTDCIQRSCIFWLRWSLREVAHGLTLSGLPPCAYSSHRSVYSTSHVGM